MTKPFSAIGVIGSGTMGAGIAQLCATRGYRTILYDIDNEVLDRATERLRETVERAIAKGKMDQIALSRLKDNLRTSVNLYELGEDLEIIIEAAPESMPLKLELFRKLDEICPDETILASNTSSLSITALAGATRHPGRVAGLHFFNPAPLMKLVEVIAGKETSPEVLEHLCRFAESLDKTPVQAKDSPGFIVNRVARAFYGEAFRLVGEGAADFAQVDCIMRAEGGFKMGPFELMDLIGIDVNYAVTQSVYDAYFQEPRFAPHPMQRQMVEAGLLGRKTGKGFYVYD